MQREQKLIWVGGLSVTVPVLTKEEESVFLGYYLPAGTMGDASATALFVLYIDHMGFTLREAGERLHKAVSEIDNNRQASPDAFAEGSDRNKAST